MTAVAIRQQRQANRHRSFGLRRCIQWRIVPMATPFRLRRSGCGTGTTSANATSGYGPAYNALNAATYKQLEVMSLPQIAVDFPSPCLRARCASKGVRAIGSVLRFCNRSAVSHPAKSIVAELSCFPGEVVSILIRSPLGPRSGTRASGQFLCPTFR